MREQQPEGGSEYSGYLADVEHQAYVDAGGAKAEQAAQSGGFFESVPAYFNQMVAHAKADQAASQYAQERRRALAQDLEMREGAHMGDANYLSYSHGQLRSFIENDFDPASVHEVGRVYHEIGTAFVDFRATLRNSAATSEQDWQGEAGQMARGYIQNLGDYIGKAGDGYRLVANQTGLQAESAERTRNSFPEEPDFDPAQAYRDIVVTPNPFTMGDQLEEFRANMEKKQAAHEEAARVMQTMSDDFHRASTSMPAFEEPPPMDPSSGQNAPTGSDTAGSIGGFVDPGGTGGSPSATYSASAPSSVATPSAPTPSGYTSNPAPSPTPGTQAPAGTSSSWANSNGGLPPGAFRGLDGVVYRQDPNTGQWMRQNSANGRWAPVPPGRSVPGLGGGATGTGGGGSVRGGLGGGRTGGGFGPRGSAPEQPLAPGGRSGASKPSAPSTGSATSAASNTSSSSRAPARMPMGGAGQNQQGGEDEEHERKYTLDTDEIMEGAHIDRVAPPVLGALPDEEGGDR